MDNAPDHLVWFNGTRVPMDQHQYEQAVRDGALCRCGNCLSCATYRDAYNPHPPSISETL